MNEEDIEENDSQIPDGDLQISIFDANGSHI